MNADPFGTTPGVAVDAPIRWQQVGLHLRSNSYNPKLVQQHLARMAEMVPPEFTSIKRLANGFVMRAPYVFYFIILRCRQLVSHCTYYRADNWLDLIGVILGVIWRVVVSSWQFLWKWCCCCVHGVGAGAGATGGADNSNMDERTSRNSNNSATSGVAKPNTPSGGDGMSSHPAPAKKLRHLHTFEWFSNALIVLVIIQLYGFTSAVNIKDNGNETADSVHGFAGGGALTVDEWVFFGWVVEILFFCEMLVRMFAMGFHSYWYTTGTATDGLCNIITLIAMLPMSQHPSSFDAAYYLVVVFQSLRLQRIFSYLHGSDKFEAIRPIFIRCLLSLIHI